MFFDNFKRICKEKGTSPTTVVRKLGLSTSKLALWKNGSIPKEKYLVMIAEHLDISVAQLFGGLGKSNSEIIKGDWWAEND